MGRPAVITFTVPGIPQPKGSKKIVGKSKTTGRPIMINDAAGLKAWAKAVETSAMVERVRNGGTLLGPVRVRVVFHMPRPDRPAFDVPAVKPDIDKLLRAVFDGITKGRLWEDDARVVWCLAEKVYGDPGVTVTLQKAIPGS